MLNCDYTLVQGIATTSILKHKVQFIVGNPRYGTPKDIHKSENKYDVLINLNFTYGVSANKGERWLKDIIDSLKIANRNYMIIEHPRNAIPAPKDKIIKTSAKNIEEILKSSNLLITRFSSLVHESIIAGCKVIYFNPKLESMVYNWGQNTEIFEMVEDKESLTQVLNSPLKNNRKAQISYLNSQIGNIDGLVNTRISQALKVGYNNKSNLQKVPFSYSFRKLCAQMKNIFIFKTRNIFSK